MALVLNLPSQAQFAPLPPADLQRVLDTGNGRATVAVAVTPKNGRDREQPIPRSRIREIMAQNWQGPVAWEIWEAYIIMMCRYANRRVGTTAGIKKFYSLSFNWFNDLRPGPQQHYDWAHRDLRALGIEERNLLKVPYLFLAIQDPAPNGHHGFFIVLSGTWKTLDCYDSWAPNRRQRMVTSLTWLVAFLSHELGNKFVPDEWTMRFPDRVFQNPQATDCLVHICIFAMCVIYDWLPNYNVPGPGGISILPRLMRAKRERIAAEIMDTTFTGVFDYNFPVPYPHIPMDIFGYHMLWNRVTRTLPNNVRRRRANLVNMTKIQLAAFCDAEPGFTLGPTPLKGWKGWKRLPKDVFLQNVEQRLSDRGIEDADAWAQRHGIL